MEITVSSLIPALLVLVQPVMGYTLFTNATVDNSTLPAAKIQTLGTAG